MAAFQRMAERVGIERPGAMNGPTFQRWTGPPKARGPGRRLEEAEQRALMSWADLVQVGQHTLAQWLIHVPNGGGRSKAEGGILKAMGVKAGVPDLLLPIRTARYSAGWWELKYGDGSLSQAQRDRIAMLRAGGAYCGVYWHWQECAVDVLRYLEGGEFTVICRAKV